MPILSIVPIPALRIDEMTIDFTAKLTDTIEDTRSTKTAANVQAAASYKAFWSPISGSVRTSVSYEASRNSSARYSREYTMNISVRAIQDDIPAGLSRILDILEQSITEKPVSNNPPPN